ncbi:4Fe-4S dicluster domain-containing protein [Halorhabdus sp. CBA1104]|uniref:Coenzyme F420 hydrogenase/dehydrogenase, beta subunit C-terminal domain n=1 Tax=unclassified Halorhabdus TaxID=2621901 RepID=UPI0012B25D98|nr:MULTISPECIES: Coenzyme F420 hydrogenase/dehydrogenase, beta subunit C-terminal domain [unclassified Halorhabdus]QGN07471.1 4Fe-4S dicluster domain-containing protein [Halorhabdus sp. CBA1104]
MANRHPHTPAVGDDPREPTTDVQPPGNKVRFRHLDESVIEADRCVQCGACVAACPSNSIGIADSDRRPTLVKMCTGCSRCWDTCPRAGLRYERLPVLDGAAPEDVADGLGTVASAYAASAAEGVDGAQHGGAVTALLAALLDGPDGIDGAVVATESDGDGLAKPVLATSPAEVREYAGTLFTQPLQLDGLADLLDEAELPADPDLALVGTPCVIEGVSALERSPYREARFDEARPLEAIDLTIALTCTQAFDDEGLEHVLATEYDLAVDDVARFDLVGQGIHIETTDGGHERASLADFAGAVLEGCLECADATGQTADLTVGTVGSPQGESTLLVRTERGTDAFERARDALEARALDDRGPIEQLADWNAGRAREAMARSFDPEGDVWISHATHRDAYDETDRAPVAFNPARVHQYEEWC